MESSGSKTERNKKKKKTNSSSKKLTERGEEEIWPRKNKVTLEGTIESIDQGSGSGGRISGNNGNTSSSVGRTKSLTDEDLEELKGCLDLGFGFSYDEIPELCNTLPALELCYSMSQRFLDDSSCCGEDSSSTALTSFSASSSSSSSSAQVANWKIASPGDHPEEVKARLRYWAQAVACTVRLCAADAK